jgi:hypothetical protein
VLDLDNTLIYSVPFHKFPKRQSVLHDKPHHFMDEEYVIFERPGLQEFLDFLFANFNVMVWSAASPEYVEFIVENILMAKEGRRFEYVLNSENCEDCQDYYGEDQFKNLRYLWDIHDLPGYGPYNTLIVDDLGLVRKTQPNNSIQVKSFSTCKKDCWNDNELLGRVKPMLEEILKHFNENVENDSFVLVEL